MSDLQELTSELMLDSEFKKEYAALQSEMDAMRDKLNFKHKQLEERAAEYDGNLHLDCELDWGEPMGRENW